MHAKRLTTGIVCGCCLIILCAAFATADEKAKASKSELSRAEHFLKKLEAKVLRARGQPFKPGYEGNEALKRVKALKLKYPEDGNVEKLFQRARQAYLASTGATMAIPPEMLKYRENEKILKAMFFEKAEKKWKAFREKIAATGKLIEKPFPPPSPRTTSYREMVGRYVILENFQYPTNEFKDMGHQYVFVGSGVRGYYYVQLSNRAWLGAYEAAKRYRRLINRDMPEGAKWTLVGKITTVDLLVPQAGKKKTRSAFYGWSLEPVAIYVPGRTFAWADPKLELGGAFAGEEQMEQIKSTFYTITEIPKDVKPQRLVEIFATAIKEKNYPLYLDCIDPERRKTPKALSRIMYFWEWHQHRFATFYVHVIVGKAKVSVLRGFDMGKGSAGEFFLTPEERAKIKKHSEPLVEQAFLTSKAFDERGRQYGSPKPRFLKRVEKKRWYIVNFPQPF